MPRIRSVHPGLFTDEGFMELTVSDPLACVLLPGIWTDCDDQGVFEWKPMTIKARVLPCATADVSSLLMRLCEVGFIRRFEVKGKAYGAVRNFRRFQRPEKPKAYHPLPDDLRVFVGLEKPGGRGGGDDPQPGGGGKENVKGTLPDQSPTIRQPVVDWLGPIETEGKGEEEGVGDSPLRGDGASGAPPKAEVVAFPDADTLRLRLFHEGLAILERLKPGMKAEAKRELIGALAKAKGGAAVGGTRAVQALRDAEAGVADRTIVGDPVKWLWGAIHDANGTSRKKRAEAAAQGPRLGNGSGSALLKVMDQEGLL